MRTPEADETATVIVVAGVEVGLHAGVKSGLVDLLLGLDLGTSVEGQKSDVAGCLRAQILIL